MTKYSVLKSLINLLILEINLTTTGTIIRHVPFLVSHLFKQWRSAMYVKSSFFYHMEFPRRKFPVFFEEIEFWRKSSFLTKSSFDENRDFTKIEFWRKSIFYENRVFWPNRIWRKSRFFTYRVFLQIHFFDIIKFGENRVLTKI